MENARDIIKIATDFAKARKFHDLETMIELSCAMLKQRLVLFVDIDNPQARLPQNTEMLESHIEFLDYEGVSPQSVHEANEENIDYAFKWQQDDSGKFIATRWNINNSYQTALENRVLYKRQSDGEELLALVSLSTKAQIKIDMKMYAIILVYENDMWRVSNTICLEKWETQKLSWYPSIKRAELEARVTKDTSTGAKANTKVGFNTSLDIDSALTKPSQVCNTRNSKADADADADADDYWHQFDNLDNSDQDDYQEGYQGQNLSASQLSETTEFSNMKHADNPDTKFELLDKENYDIINDDATEPLASSVVDYIKSFPLFNKPSAKTPFYSAQSSTMLNDLSNKQPNKDDLYHLNQSLASLSHFAKKSGITRSDFLCIAEQSYKD